MDALQKFEEKFKNLAKLDNKIKSVFIELDYDYGVFSEVSIEYGNKSYSYDNIDNAFDPELPKTIEDKTKKEMLKLAKSAGPMLWKHINEIEMDTRLKIDNKGRITVGSINMRHLTLKTEPFGQGKFKIELPSRSDATMELFEVIYDSTELDIAMEDDGYIVVETESQNEANEIKKVVEDFLNGKLDEAQASKYGDVKGTQPAQKDFDRIEGIVTKGGGDGHKVLKLAQNMANTFKTSTSYEKCLRRANAAEELGYDAIAEIFFKKAEEIKPEQAAASYEWETINDNYNKQITVEVGDEEVTVDVIKDELHVIGVDTKHFNLEVPIDGDSFDRAMIAANKFIDALNPEILKSKKDTEDLLLAMLGRSTRTDFPGSVEASDGKRVGKLSYRKEGLGDSASWFMIDGRAWFQLKDQESAKELKKQGLTFRFHVNEMDEAVDLEPVASSSTNDISFDLKIPKYGDEQTSFLNKLKNAFGDINAKFITSTLLKVFNCTDEMFKSICNKFGEDIDFGISTAADFLENKYSNEEEEFTIEEFEKDAGPIPDLKKYKNAFYSIVHYNKDTEQFEIMVYPKEQDYKKNNPKVVVLDSGLSTVATSATDDSESRNPRWGFHGSLVMSPFDLSDADAHDCFVFTVQLISDKTGYVENVIRDFLDSQAGRYFADMVTYKSFESKNLQSVMEAIKETIGEGALGKLRFENFVANHDPADFEESTTTASTSSNYDIFIDELEKAKARDPQVSEKFHAKWHHLDKVADFFAEVYNGGLNQFLDHYGDTIPRSALADVGGKACKEILDIVRDGSDSIKDYVELMSQGNDSTPDEDYEEVLEPIDEMTNKIYENDKIEQACGEILEFYGVK